MDLYRNGVFPMADNRDDPRLFVIDPEIRGIFELNNFHIPKRLKRIVAQQPYQISANQCFEDTIIACAELNQKRKATWINDEIIRLYCELNRQSHAHSIEVWENGELVGGLYGVSLGGAFFGESMFSKRPNASKIALVHLVAALKFARYELLDAQYHNNHLEQFGIKEIPRTEFHAILAKALEINCKFPTEYFAKPIIAWPFLQQWEQLEVLPRASHSQSADLADQPAFPARPQGFLSFGPECLKLL